MLRYAPRFHKFFPKSKKKPKLAKKAKFFKKNAPKKILKKPKKPKFATDQGYMTQIVDDGVRVHI
jgi:hypothetical protein